jgi:virulence-associated protein VapD
LLPGGREAAVAVLGLSQVGPDGLPKLADRAALAGFLQHELAHAYVNPAVDQQAAALEDVGRRLYERVAARMKAQAYTDWRIMLSETIVRASTVLFLKDRFGEQAAAAAMFQDRARAFAWIAEVVADFDRYRSVHRSKRSFPAQVRALGAVLERWLQTPEDQRSQPFVGPINAVFDARFRRADRMVLVAPAVLPSDPGGRAASDYVGQVHRMFFAKHQVALRPVDQVTVAEQAQAMVLYGTPASNPLLAGLLQGFGGRVDPQAITLGQRRFDGPHLALIACHPHPKDPSRPVLVYAAADSLDLVGINNLFHGGTDWVVARRVGDGTFQEVAKGDFPKTLSGGMLRLGE